MKKLLFIFCLIFFFVNVYSLTNAQSARSQCVTTKVGSPSGTPPPLPPGCAGSGGGGDYHVPLNPEVITSIMNEMGSYAGSYRHLGHDEHPGLDLMTPVGARVPVFAVTDGEIIFAPDDPRECNDGYDGCLLQIKHVNDNLVSWYMHIVPVEDYAIGQQIEKGEQIGVVNHWRPGNDHLHLELREQDTGHNINPRNYFPEFQQFPVNLGYNPDIRTWSAEREVPLLNDGLEFAEKFGVHPPCVYNGRGNTREYCWAY